MIGGAVDRKEDSVNKGMIPALLACFFGAALSTACDPQNLTKPQIDIVPTFGSLNMIGGECDH